MKRIISILTITVAAVALASHGSLFQQSWDQAWRGDHQNAVRSYRKFAQENPEHALAPAALFNAASISIVELSDPESARQGFLNVVGNYPDTRWAAESCRRLGEIAFAQQKPQEAEKYYRLGLERARGKDYRMPDVWIAEMVQGCRENLASVNDPELMIVSYSELTNYVRSGDAAAEIKYHLAGALKAVNRHEEAARTYADLMVSYPYSRWGHQAMQDERDFVRSHLEIPWDDLERIVQASALSRQFRFAEAKDIFQDIASKYQQNPLSENAEYGLITTDLYLTGDFPVALDRMRDYLDDYPQGIRSNDAEQHIESWTDVVRQEKSLEDDPEDYAIHLQLGFTLLRNGFFSQAEEHFLKAAADSSSDQAYLGLGYVYMRSNRLEEGVRSFERYLNNHRDNGNVFNQIGYAYLGLGQMEKALECFERYRELEPDNPNSHDSFAECLMNMGRTEEALAEYKRAIEINPDFTNPYFMLGEIYLNLGEKENALSYYHRYLELDPAGFVSSQARARVDSLSQK